MTDAPELLLAHHLKTLRLPTFLREHDKQASICAAEGLDHVRYLARLTELELIDRERRMVERRIGDAVVTAQAFQHDPDLVLGREMATGLTPDVFGHSICRGLGRRFCIGGFGLHLRSFVTTTKPKSSSNHNLKSVP